MGDEQRPAARTEGLIREALEDELLVYDLESDEAHALDPQAASIWGACDGNATVAQIAARVDIDEESVLRALDRSAELGLLRRPAVPMHAHTRRYVLRRGMMAGAAGFAAAPIIHSIVAPTPAQAQASCTPDGGHCDGTNPGACCSLTCCIDAPPAPPNTCCGSARAPRRGLFRSARQS